MSLTSAELTLLKTDINANTDQTVIDALAAGALGQIANWYNQDASPSYWIYRKQVDTDEIREAIDIQDIADITDTDSSRVMRILDIRQEIGFSGDNPRDRSAWDDVFSAAAGDNSQQAIAALWARLATYAEKVQAESTGSGANAANADATTWQGTLSSSDVSNALNS